jgi:tripartite-type tricarboxylate transporter receptor subunit TctC
MKNAMRRALTASALAAVTVVLGTSASDVGAQGWPNKPITLVVPFPPGGGTDAFARPLSAQLTKQLGKQVIIDNRGGAVGTVGASIAAKAPPDGYTFFIGAVHHTIAPSCYPKFDYDIEKDLVPKDVLDRMHEEVLKALSTAELREIWASNGSEVTVMKQDEFALFVRNETKRGSEVTRVSRAKLD